MPTELVQRVRAKYPEQYKDLSDSELEQRVLAKYPEYKDLATPLSGTPQGPAATAAGLVAPPQRSAGGVPSHPMASNLRAATTRLATSGVPTRPATIGPPPPRWTQVSRLVVPGGGALAGAAGGAALGTTILPGIGTGIGAALGAGVGGGAGELLETGIEKLSGRPITAEGAQSRTIETAVASMLGEGAFRSVLAPVARRLLAPFAREITPAGHEAIDSLMRPAERSRLNPMRYLPERMGGGVTHDVPLVTPAQVSSSSGLGFTEGVTQGAIFGRGTRKELLARQAAALTEDAQARLALLGGSHVAEEAGKSYQGELAENIAKRAAEASRRYGALEKQAEGARVTLTKVEDVVAKDARAKPLLYRALDYVAPGWREAAEHKDAAALLDASPGTDIPTVMRDALKAAGFTLDEGTGSLSFKEARDLRTAFGSALRRANRDLTGNSDISGGLGKRLYGALDESIDDALKGYPGVQAALRETDAWYRAEQGRLLSDTMRKLAKSSPSTLATVIVQGQKAGRLERIRAARAAVSPRTWNGVAERAVDALLHGPEGTIQLGPQVEKRLLAIGKPELEAALPPGASDGLWEFARILKQLAPQKDMPGRLAIQLKQAGAVGAVATGVFLTTRDTSDTMIAAGAVLLGPAALAKIMLSPTGRKWLTVGLEAPRGSSLAVEAATQLMALLARPDPDVVHNDQPPRRDALGEDLANSLAQPPSRGGPVLVKPDNTRVPARTGRPPTRSEVQTSAVPAR